MKNETKLITSTLLVVAIIAVIGLAGKEDYVQEVIYTMPATVHVAIVKKLGTEATDADIAAEYINNQERYNNVK